MKLILCAVRTNIAMETMCPFGGVLSLASVLGGRGDHQVRVVLPVEYPGFRADLERELSHCDLLGISCTSYNWHVSRELIDAARQANTKLKIVLGGVHASCLPEHCLRSTAADLVIRNEGEVSFQQVVDVVARGGDLGRVAGITFKDRDGRILSTPDRPLLTACELDAMPLPAYERIPPGVYGYVPFEGSRGCLFDCAFCGVLFRKSHRVISSSRVEALLRRLRLLKDRFTMGGVFFTDDSFGTRHRESRAILEAFAPTGYVLGLESRYHDLLHCELMPAMERNRFFLIQVGVEAGYQEGVDRVNKRLSLGKVYRFAGEISGRSFSKAVYYSMTIGLPWEGKKHLFATIDTAFDLAVRSGSPPPMLNNFNPLPNSSIVTRPADFGMPGLTPSFWDDGNWFRPFLRFAVVSEEDRRFFASYIARRRALHPCAHAISDPEMKPCESRR